MELFDNLVAFEPTQRPSISEIRQSKWMKEINWELKNELKNEFMRREKLKEQNQMMNMMNNKAKNGNNININNNGKAKNVDDILAKIKERKKIEVVNDIRKQLFPNNINNKQNFEREKKLAEKNEQNLNSKDNNQNGFIQLNVNIKNLNSLILILKSFLKNEGYNITQKDLTHSKIEISNGEIDVSLFFEKMYKIVKISFSLIKTGKSF